MLNKIIFKIALLIGILMPGLVLAQTTGQSSGERLQDIMGQAGFSGTPLTLQQFLVNLIAYALGFVGVLFLIMIIVSGLQWMNAGGNEETITKAQGRLKNAIIGFVVILASYSITIFTGTNLQSLATINNPASVLVKAIVIVLGLVGLLFLVNVIIAGAQWMASGGNQEKVGAAQKRLRNAAIGIVIVMMAYSITIYVNKMMYLGTCTSGQNCDLRPGSGGCLNDNNCIHDLGVNYSCNKNGSCTWNYCENNGMCVGQFGNGATCDSNHHCHRAPR